MKRLLLVIMVFAVVLAGCSEPAVPVPESPLTELGDRFQVSLPRLTVNIAEDGTPSILGLSPAILKFAGVDTEAFKFPTDTVEKLTAAGIQHIEVAVVDRGLRIWANGKPLPFVQTDTASLQRTVDVMDALGVEQAALLQRLLPILTRLGIDVVLKFPIQPGAAEVPITVVGDARTPTLAPTTDPASVIAKLEVKYDEQGKPMIMGFDASSVVGQVLSPELIQQLQAGGIQTLELRNAPEGFTAYVNSEPLPTLQWDTALLGNLAEVVGGYLGAESEVLPLIEAFLPTLDRGDVDILIHLPLAPGVEPLPVRMHD